MTKEIKLSQGQVALVSDHRYEELNQYRWYATWSESSQSYYASRSENRRTILMHRQILQPPKGMQVDHINHDTLDNTDENLRAVTYSQNRMNSRVRCDNKLGVKNIVFHKNRYQLRIWKGGQVVFYKRVVDLDEAIALRDQKLKEIHGSYACGSGCA